MKKIITLVLALALVAVALVSCGGAAGLSGFASAFKATNPDRYSIVTKIVTKGGDELNGSFSVAVNGGEGTITYTYDKLNPSTAETPILTLSGTAQFSGNKITGDVSAEASTAFKVSPKLNEKSFSEINVGQDILTGTVPAANTEAVLGVAIGSDVTLTMTKNGDQMVSLSIAYTTTLGAVTATIYY